MSGAAVGTDHAGPDLILAGGKVVTVDRTFGIEQAVAVKGERIMAVGGAADIRALADSATKIVDLAGKTVIPGLIDGHSHMDREGLKPVFPSLAGCRSIADVLACIRDIARTRKPGDWIVTMPIGDPPYYWDTPNNLAERRYPTRRELDEAAPENPVYIRPIWGFWRHVLPIDSVANSLALALAGIGKTTPAPCESVVFEKDAATGDLTGLIRENTYMPIVELGFFNSMPRFTSADRMNGLKQSMRLYNATGTTSVLEEHGVAQELISAYQAVRATGQSTVRATLVFSPAWGPAGGANGPDYGAVLRSWAGWLGNRGLGDDWLRVEGLFTEFGVTLENLWRAKASPYTGWSGFNYDCGVPRERMVDFLTEAARADIRMAALWPEFIDLYAEVNKRVPIAGKRWIVGHLNRLTPAQIRTVVELGIVITTHTNRYLYKEGHLTRQAVGPTLENEIVPLKSLREAGAHVGLATDNVPTSLFHPIWHAVSRFNRYSEDSIAPAQKVSREDALRMATNEGAYLTFEEDVKGAIEPGKLADMAILSDDPLACAEDAIKDIVAETTIVGGRIVYERCTP